MNQRKWLKDRRNKTRSRESKLMNMQAKSETDLRQVEQIMEEARGGIIQEKERNASNDPSNENAVDSSKALQLLLDRIPISSIPGVSNSSSEVLELKTKDSVEDAVRSLYEKNVLGAPISEPGGEVSETAACRKTTDPYMGFIDLARIVLWCIEECEKPNANGQAKDESRKGIFSMLEQNPRISQTKIGELAKSFLWDPFFPVHLDDSLFHVLLLLSKHPLQIVPVTEQSSSKVIGFVTQNAVIQLLLQSSGLEWFDSIADKALSEFRFENEDRAVFLYGEQSVAEALHFLWENQVGAVAVVERETKRVIGCVRSSDLHLLLDNDDLFDNRKDRCKRQQASNLHQAIGRPALSHNLGTFKQANRAKVEAAHFGCCGASDALPPWHAGVLRQGNTVKCAASRRSMIQRKSNYELLAICSTGFCVMGNFCKPARRCKGDQQRGQHESRRGTGQLKEVLASTQFCFYFSVLFGTEQKYINRKQKRLEGFCWEATTVALQGLPVAAQFQRPSLMLPLADKEAKPATAMLPIIFLFMNIPLKNTYVMAQGCGRREVHPRGQREGRLQPCHRTRPGSVSIGGGSHHEKQLSSKDGLSGHQPEN